MSESPSLENDIIPDYDSLKQIYNTLFFNSDIGVKIVDKNFKINAINQKALEYLDIQGKKVIGKPCNIGCNFATPCNLPGRQAVKQGIVVNCTVEKISPDGEVIPLHIKAIPLIDKNGKSNGFIEIIESLKNKHQAEMDKDRLFNLSPYIIGIVNEEGIVTRINPAIEKVLGWKPEEICGKSFQKLIHPDDYDKTKQKIISVIKENGLLNGFENRYVAKDGSYRDFSWDAFYLKEYKQLFTIGRDITETKKMQTQLLQAQKMESIGKLAGGIAHDFNNMLSAIIGSAQMLKSSINPHDQNIEEFVDIIMEAAKNASDLTKRLLSFSRKGNYISVPIDVNALINQVITLFSHTLTPQITIKKNLTKLSLQIDGDPSFLQNALLNLALNAKDAINNSKGVITFTSEFVPASKLPANSDFNVNNNFVAISIADTGTGIKKEDYKNIFEPFFTTKEHGKGTGLGLSAVLGTIQLHNGHILFDSTFEKGSTFTIYLPLDAKSETPISTATKTTPTLNGLKILFVDDEKMIRMISKAMLESLGCQVTTAKNGSDGLEKFKSSNNHDIAIIDMLMPNMSGNELALQLLKIKPNLKILLISAFCVAEKTAPILAKPNTAFLNKPFNMQELRNALSTL